MGLRSASEPLTKVTLNLYRADVNRLKQLYPANHSTFLRHLLRAHLNKIEAKITVDGESLVEEINFE